MTPATPNDELDYQPFNPVATCFWWAIGALLLLYTSHLVFDDSAQITAAMHATTGYWWLLSVPFVAVALATRSTKQLAASTGLLALALSWVVPGQLAGGAHGAPALRLLTSNVLMVHPDPNALIAEWVSHEPDIILLQEVSHHWAEAISASPLLQEYTYRTMRPQSDSFGIGVLSKVPIEAAIEDFMGVPMAVVNLVVDGRALRMYNIHTLPPRTAEYTERWYEQMAALATLTIHSDVPILIAGDFNATRHHPSYNRLLKAGLADAHSEVGRAAASTWPNGLFPLPPMRLDHVLVGPQLAVQTVTEGLALGSDHNPVIVELAWTDR